MFSPIFFSAGSRFDVSDDTILIRQSLDINFYSAMMMADNGLKNVSNASIRDSAAPSVEKDGQ